MPLPTARDRHAAISRNAIGALLSRVVGGSARSATTRPAGIAFLGIPPTCAGNARLDRLATMDHGLARSGCQETGVAQYERMACFVGSRDRGGGGVWTAIQPLRAVGRWEIGRASWTETG